MLGDVLEEEGAGHPLAHRAALEVREGHDDGVTSPERIRWGRVSRVSIPAQWPRSARIVHCSRSRGPAPATVPGPDVRGWDTGAMTPPGARPLIGVTTYRQETRWWSWDRDAAAGARASTSTWWWPPGAGRCCSRRSARAWPTTRPAPSPRWPARWSRPWTAWWSSAVGDVEAERYGQEPDGRNGGMNEYRDELGAPPPGGRPRAGPAAPGRLPWSPGPQRAARRDPGPAAARPPGHDAPPAGGPAPSAR